MIIHLVVVLGLDTTTLSGSVAIARDGRVVVDRTGDPTVTHGRRLPGDVIDALEEAGIDAADVDVWSVAAGPGSFTGLRVGIATIQGLAFASDRKVVPVPTLEALAYAAALTKDASEARLVGVVMDARRNEVFSALYRLDTAGSSQRMLEPVVAAAVGRLDAVPHAWSAHAAGTIMALTGDAADAAAFERAGLNVMAVQSAPSIAAACALLGCARVDSAVLPHAIRPIYVRRPDAEIAREKRL